MSTGLLLGLAALGLTVGLYLVRYSSGRERRRPEAVLVVGVLLVRTAMFLVAVQVRISPQNDLRRQLDSPSQEGRSAAPAARPDLRGILGETSAAPGRESLIPFAPPSAWVRD